MRQQGKISSWKDDQGFGFITPDNGGRTVFVHIKSFVDRQRRPAVKDIVTFEAKTDAKGRARAENVAMAGVRVSSSTSAPRGMAPIFASVVFLSSLGAMAFAGKLPFILLWIYLALSIVTFLAYAIDKSAARNDRRRIRESTLHMFALVGGWPGGLIAQRVLRHKSKKQSFRIEFWLVSLLNCGVLGWLVTSHGAGMRRDIDGVWTAIRQVVFRIFEAL
jgi:uncharacterized membrane protein YsdA (DUF1294 family)/cold shock CspA family protein